MKYNYFEIIMNYFSVSFHIFNHIWSWNKIISATEKVLRLFQNYFSDNEMLDDIHELQ